MTISGLTPSVLSNRLSRIKVSDDFQERAARFAITLRQARKRRLYLFGYLLGFLIGDAAKRKATPGSEMFMELMLTKKHEENLRLGELVCLCANACGIRFSRINDRVMNDRLPYGRYHWKSQHSALVTWMFEKCLGLRHGQLTTYDPVSIDWVCSMDREFRISFLPGLADSDGYIHLQNQEAHVIVSPNLGSIRKIVDTLGIKYRIGKSKGMDLIKMDSKTAMALPIFSPIAESYRYSFLSIVANARRLRRGPWPPCLASRVDELISQGLSTGEVLREILTEDGIIIRATNVRRHRANLSRKY